MFLDSVHNKILAKTNATDTGESNIAKKKQKLISIIQHVYNQQP